MRKPRPTDFDPHHSQRKPDVVNLTGTVPLQAQADVFSSSQPEIKQPAYAEQASLSEKTTSAVSQDHSITTPRHHDTTLSPTDENRIRQVRRAVREFGKEAATHRFTQAEKQAIAEAVYAYKTRGIRTSENEIARIAINFLFSDYRANGEKSILHQCLLSLNE
jgi:hypothetical protein